MYERNKVCFNFSLHVPPYWQLIFCCQAEYVEKLDAGLHSTKGVGKTEPDPAGDKELDGCKVTEICLQ